MFLIIQSVLQMRKNAHAPTFPAIMLISEILFMILGPAIGFYRFDDYGGEIPFSKQHVLIIILLTITSSLCFWIAKFTGNSTNPFLRIAVSAGMFLGLVFTFISAIHFIPFIPLGFIYPIFGFELLSPVIAFFFLLKEFWFYNKFELNLTELLPYRAELGFIPWTHRVWQLPFSQRVVFYLCLLIPIVILHSLFAYACGQEIDSLIKAYTYSNGFIFSTH
ncbi:MAG: hypothetical protein M3R27_00410 [Bacteroidota bacterium]|nr:hypothetical protein [Bacteroidota bacterium]